jgi:hypothetical protein
MAERSEVATVNNGMTRGRMGDVVRCELLY